MSDPHVAVSRKIIERTLLICDYSVLVSNKTVFSDQALLQAHDEVLKNTSGVEVNPYQTDGSPGYNSRHIDDSVGDRPEKLTRVRLVQFHKHPNEPMVSSSCNLVCAQCGLVFLESRGKMSPHFFIGG